MAAPLVHMFFCKRHDDVTWSAEEECTQCEASADDCELVPLALGWREKSPARWRFSMSHEKLDHALRSCGGGYRVRYVELLLESCYSKVATINADATAAAAAAAAAPDTTTTFVLRAEK